MVLSKCICQALLPGAAPSLLWYVTANYCCMARPATQPNTYALLKYLNTLIPNPE